MIWTYSAFAIALASCIGCEVAGETGLANDLDFVADDGCDIDGNARCALGLLQRRAAEQNSVASASASTTESSANMFLSISEADNSHRQRNVTEIAQVNDNQSLANGNLNWGGERYFPPFDTYWDGQCSPCPAYLYPHCRSGGRLVGSRYHPWRACCEGRCSKPPATPPSPPIPPAIPSPPSSQPPPSNPAPAPALPPPPAHDYWDGECTPCPAYLYKHCSLGGKLSTYRFNFRRGCCEGYCVFPKTPSPPPSSAAPPAAPNPSLVVPSKAELQTFYMYRAMSDSSYPPSNVNTGNLAGVMWYIQNEVVSGAYGKGNKFGINRIIRYKVQHKATQPLIEKGMHFGVRVAFDSGQCTGPKCKYSWSHFGYNVGCNKLGDYPFPEFNTHYPAGIWYSLPGKCPSSTYKTQTAGCETQEPGGRCAGPPTGTWDCTWSYEDKGEQITFDELYAFAGNVTQDVFWRDAHDDAACSKRLKTASALFSQKYGNELADPVCDFNKWRFFS